MLVKMGNWVVDIRVDGKGLWVQQEMYYVLLSRDVLAYMHGGKVLMYD